MSSNAIADWIEQECVTLEWSTLENELQRCGCRWILKDVLDQRAKVLRLLRFFRLMSRREDVTRNKVRERMMEHEPTYFALGFMARAWAASVNRIQ